MFGATARTIERVLNVVLVVMIAVMAISICYQVIGRYLLNHAPGWTAELARFLMAWTTMLGSAAVIRSDGHISVTFVADSLPPALAVVVGWLRDTIILVMAGGLVFYGFTFAEIGGRRESAAIEISMFWPYLAIPVGGTLIALLLALRRAAELAGEEDRP